MKIKSLGYLWIESTDLSKWRDYGTNILGLQLAPTMPAKAEISPPPGACPPRLRSSSCRRSQALRATAAISSGVKGFAT